MNRRDFVSKTLLATGASAITSAAFASEKNIASPEKFKMKYAPHFGMFENSAGKDLFDQLKFMSDNGFTAMEDNGMMARPVDVQSKIGETMAKLNLTMGVFVVDGGDNWKVSLTTGKAEFKDNFLKTCRAAVETAKRCNAKWMTVVPGYFERNLPMGYQTANVIDALRRAAEIFEPHGLVMVLEPLSDNPDLFLRFSDQSYEVCKAVNSPSCKILFDMYHMQRNEGNMIARMDLAWDEIGYFQIGDNPGRKEPTTGEVNYKNIFKHLYEKGYKGVLGTEHGNSLSGKEGEIKTIEAYRWSDNF